MLNWYFMGYPATTLFAIFTNSMPYRKAKALFCQTRRAAAVIRRTTQEIQQPKCFKKSTTPQSKSYKLLKITTIECRLNSLRKDSSASISSVLGVSFMQFCKVTELLNTTNYFRKATANLSQVLRSPRYKMQ